MILISYTVYPKQLIKTQLKIQLPILSILTVPVPWKHTSNQTISSPCLFTSIVLRGRYWCFCCLKEEMLTLQEPKCHQKAAVFWAMLPLATTPGENDVKIIRKQRRNRVKMADAESFLSNQMNNFCLLLKVHKSNFVYKYYST